MQKGVALIDRILRLNVAGLLNAAQPALQIGQSVLVAFGQRLTNGSGIWTAFRISWMTSDNILGCKFWVHLFVSSISKAE